jgi:ribosomal protein S14
MLLPLHIHIIWIVIKTSWPYWLVLFYQKGLILVNTMRIRTIRHLPPFTNECYLGRGHSWTTTMCKKKQYLGGSKTVRARIQTKRNKQTPRPESASELYRPSDRRLSAKLVTTFAYRGVLRGQRDGSPRPYSRFLDRSRYCFFQVAPQLYS